MEIPPFYISRNIMEMVAILKKNGSHIKFECFYQKKTQKVINIFEILKKIPRPTTKKQVRSVLGLVGNYRDHIPAVAQITVLLIDLLKNRHWNDAQERAWSLLKEYLLQVPILKAS